jgi:hypothetical protein
MSGGSWVQSPVWLSFLFNKKMKSDAGKLREPELFTRKDPKKFNVTEYVGRM